MLCCFRPVPGRGKPSAARREDVAVRTSIAAEAVTPQPGATEVPDTDRESPEPFTAPTLWRKTLLNSLSSLFSNGQSWYQLVGCWVVGSDGETCVCAGTFQSGGTRGSPAILPTGSIVHLSATEPSSVAQALRSREPISSVLPAHAPAPEGLPTDWRSIHERLCRAHSSAAGHQRGANAGSSPLSRMGWHMAALPLMKPNGDDSGNRPPILGVLLVVTELLQPSAASSDGPVQERPGGNTAAADVPEVGPPSSVHTASEAFKANLLSRLGAGTINPKPDATKASLLASRPTSTNSTAGHLLVSADVSVGRGGAESATLQSLTLEASVGGGTPREALSRISLPVSGHRAHRRSLVLSSKGVPVPGAAAGGSAQGEDIQGGPGSQRLQQQVQWSGEQQALQQLQAAADALAAECLVPDELRACAYKLCTMAKAIADAGDHATLLRHAAASLQAILTSTDAELPPLRSTLGLLLPRTSTATTATAGGSATHPFLQPQLQLYCGQDARPPVTLPMAQTLLSRSQTTDPRDGGASAEAHPRANNSTIFTLEPISPESGAGLGACGRAAGWAAGGVAIPPSAVGPRPSLEGTTSGTMSMSGYTLDSPAVQPASLSTSPTGGPLPLLAAAAQGNGPALQQQGGQLQLQVAPPHTWRLNHRQVLLRCPEDELLPSEPHTDLDALVASGAGSARGAVVLVSCPLPSILCTVTVYVCCVGGAQDSPSLSPCDSGSRGSERSEAAAAAVSGRGAGRGAAAGKRTLPRSQLEVILHYASGAAEFVSCILEEQIITSSCGQLPGPSGRAAQRRASGLLGAASGFSSSSSGGVGAGGPHVLDVTADVSGVLTVSVAATDDEDLWGSSSSPMLSNESNATWAGLPRQYTAASHTGSHSLRGPRFHATPSLSASSSGVLQASVRAGSSSSVLRMQLHPAHAVRANTTNLSSSHTPHHHSPLARSSTVEVGHMVHAGSVDSDALYHPGGPGALEDVSNHSRESTPPSADELPAPGPQAASPEPMPAGQPFGQPRPPTSGTAAEGQLREAVPVLGPQLGMGMGLASGLLPTQELPLSTPALQAAGWPRSATVPGVQEATGQTVEPAVCLPLSGRAEQAGAGVGVDMGAGAYGGEGCSPVQPPGSYHSVSLDVPLPDTEVRRSVPEPHQHLQQQQQALGQGHGHVAEGAAVVGESGGTIGSGQRKRSLPPSKLPSPAVSAGGRAAAGLGAEADGGGDELEDDARSGRERDTGTVLRQGAGGDPEAACEWRRDLSAASARSATGAGVVMPPPWTRSWSAGAAAGGGRSPGAGSGPVLYEASGGRYRAQGLLGEQGVGGGWRSGEQARDGGAFAPGAACASPTSALQQLQQPHSAARRRPVRVLSLHKAAHQLLPLPAANPAPAAPGPAQEAGVLPHQHLHPAQSPLELNHHLQQQEPQPQPQQYHRPPQPQQQQQQLQQQEQQPQSLLAVIPYDARVNAGASVDSSARSGAAASATLAWALPHPMSSADLANSGNSGPGPQAAASRAPGTAPHLDAPTSASAAPADAFPQPIPQARGEGGVLPGTQAPYHQPVTALGPTPAPAAAPAPGQYVPRRLARSYLPSRLQQQVPNAPAATQVQLQLPPALGAPSAPAAAMHPIALQAEARLPPGPTQPGQVVAFAGTLQAAPGDAGITPMQELLARASMAAQAQPLAFTAAPSVSFARSSYGSAAATAPAAPTAAAAAATGVSFARSSYESAAAAAPGALNFARLSHGSASAAPAGPRTLSDYVIPEEEPQQYTVLETVQMMRVLSRARGEHLSSRMRRVRVTAKIASAHPESLPADLPASLSRALMAADTGAPSGPGGMGGGGATAGVWLLTGLAARRGCVELVVDLALYMPRGALHLAGDALGGRMVGPGNAWQLQGSAWGQALGEQVSGSGVGSLRCGRGSSAASAFCIHEASTASRYPAAPPPSSQAAARLLASRFVGHSPSPSSSSSGNNSTVHSSGGSQGPRESQYRRWEGEGAEQLRAEHMPKSLAARRGVPAVLLLPPETQPQPGVPGTGLLAAPGALPGAAALAASEVLKPKCGEEEWVVGQCGGVPGALLSALEQCGVPLDDGEGRCVSTHVGCGWPQPAAGVSPTHASCTDATERTPTAPGVVAAAAAEGAGVVPPTLWLPTPVGVLPYGAQQLRMVQVVAAGGGAGLGAQREYADTIRVRAAATYLHTQVAYHAQLTLERDLPDLDSGAGAGAVQAAEHGGGVAEAECAGCSVFMVDVYGSLPSQGGLLLFECCRTATGDGAAAAAAAAAALPATGAPAPFLVLPEGEAAAAAELSRLRAAMRQLHQSVASGGEVTQAEVAAEAEMAAQQLLVDLGMLLDAAAAAPPAAAATPTTCLSPTPHSPQLVGSPGGGVQQPDAAAAAAATAAAAVAATFPASFSSPSPACPATTSSATATGEATQCDDGDTQSCEECLVDLTTGVRELYHDALCLLAEPKADGCRLSAEQQAPYAEHMQDVACTLLAACAEAHMPHTAQLVLQAACSRLRLVTPEALLTGAEVDPWVGGQLLAAYRTAADKSGVALGGAEGSGQQAKAAGGDRVAEAPLSAVGAVLQGGGAQGGEDAAAGGSSGIHPSSGAQAKEVHECQSGPLQWTDDAASDGNAAGTAAAEGAEAAGSGALVQVHSAVHGTSVDGRPRGTAALGHRRQLRLSCLGLRTGPQEQGREGEEERYLQFVAERNWPLLRSCTTVNALVTLVSALRAGLTDGAGSAVSLLFFSGLQVLVMAHYCMGLRHSACRLSGRPAPPSLALPRPDRRGMVRTALACKAVRVAAYLAWGAGLMPVPSLLWNMAQMGVDAGSEATMRPLAERTPLWLSLLVIALEAPSVWWVYDRMQASHGPYWGSDRLIARTLTYCVVCATWSVLLELYWRRAYRLWLRSGGEDMEREALRLAGAGGTAAGEKTGGAGAKASLKVD